VRVWRTIGDLSAVPGPVHLAIGVLDGVHRGHQAVLRAALDQSPGTAVAVTFDPHPIQVLRPDRAPSLLTSTRHKLSLFERFGIGHALVLGFDAVIAATPAEDFVASLRRACRPLGSIAVGHDWRFGRGAGGSVALLETLGVTVHAVAPVEVDGAVARSTAVRRAVEAGDLAGAVRLLGRPASVLGTVVPGRQLGRTLGFRTANLSLAGELLPPHGVYAVRARWNGHQLTGVANLGLRPSVESGSPEPRLEVHLFDFQEDIYGDELEVEWVAFLRPEQSFPSLEALKDQIGRDVLHARAVLE
jgi:riboflavin kinase/FMN adenylyltransferase